MIDSYVVFDIETTGLQPTRDRILEIGAVKVVEAEVVDTFSTFVDAGIQIPGNITELTGIDNAMIKGAPKAGEVVADFIKFIENYVLIGHNIMFDYGFIKQNAVNYNMAFEREGLDTLKIAKGILPGCVKKNLDSLCSYYKLKPKQRHRAAFDALATKELYECLKREAVTDQQELFVPFQMIYNVKKQGPATKFQKVYLNDLAKYHKIEMNTNFDLLTKNEASRMIDNILSAYGRIQQRK